MKTRKLHRLRTAVLRICVGSLFGLFLGAVDDARGQTAYTSNTATGAWFTDRWNNSADGPDYISAYTFNRNVSFTSGAYTFAGMGGGINVGNIAVASGVTVTFTSAANTFQTAGTVRTIDVGENGLIDFSSQSFSTAAGVGFIKNGAGVLALSGNTYAGGFTLNAGTVIMRGVNAMGGGAANLLTLNGGVVASNATRTMDSTKYGGGIVIGGNVQFGELDSVASLASSSANLSFANGVSLGSANRTFTLGNNGNQTFSGVISNSGAGGITFAANSGTEGRFEITNAANSFTGDITISGGEVRFASDGSLGDADNDIIIDGGRFATTDSASYTLGADRRIFVGDGTGNSISTPGSGSLTFHHSIADKAGEIGSWAKEGDGVLELSGANTYTGTTDVTGGTLIVNGDQSAATGAVTVAAGATLGGVGTIGGATTVESGGFLTAATDGIVGEIRFDSDLTTDSGSTWLIDLVQNVNGSSDLVDVTGILNLTSSTLNLITSGAYTVGNTYTIAAYGSRVGTFSNLAEGALLSGYQISYGANAITLTAVPEPGTLGFLSLALGGLLVRRLRRVRNGAYRR